MPLLCFLPSPTSSRLGPESPLPPFPTIPSSTLRHLSAQATPPAATGTGGVERQLRGEMCFFFVCLYFAVFVHHAPSGERFPSVSCSEHIRSHLLLEKKKRKKVQLVCGIQRTEVGTRVHASAPNGVALRRRCTAATSSITCAYMQIPTYMHV